ncbi:hypothetical protein [Paenibacillus sp. BAC0078]
MKMKIPSFIKKVLAVVLSFALLFGFSKLSVFADEQKLETFSSNYKVLENNDETLSISTRYVQSSNVIFRLAKNDDIEGIMTLDKTTHDITLKTNEKSKISDKQERIYNVVINDLTGENGDLINATFTDVETNETYQIDQSKTTASIPVLIPLGAIIGEWLLAQLIAAGTAITIGGITYAIWDSVATSLRNKKEYAHYQAKIITGQVGIGNPISLVQASARLQSSDIYNNNVWSINAANAALVAQVAGGGLLPEGPELEVDPKIGFVYHTHYHIWNRTGGHSFF